MSLDVRRALRLMGRALRLRCPNCGSAGLWQSYFRIRERCPGCGIRLERGESGYIVGAATFNIIVAELSFMAVFIGVLFATWPSPPWALLQWGGLAMMVVMPIAFYPFSKTTFLAFDLVFRPRGYEDLESIEADPRA
jgi:uncharacterized protein (DUF983 family)